jgi:hypothetical protein
MDVHANTISTTQIIPASGALMRGKPQDIHLPHIPAFKKWIFELDTINCLSFQRH